MDGAVFDPQRDLGLRRLPPMSALRCRRGAGIARKDVRGLDSVVLSSLLEASRMTTTVAHSQPLVPRRVVSPRRALQPNCAYGKHDRGNECVEAAWISPCVSRWSRASATISHAFGGTSERPPSSRRPRSMPRRYTVGLMWRGPSGIFIAQRNTGRKPVQPQGRDQAMAGSTEYCAGLGARPGT